MTTSRNGLREAIERLKYGNTSSRIGEWLLGWTERAEPGDDYGARLLAEDDDGNWLVPHHTKPEWWQGRWRWWRLDHWPSYLRSRRRNTYVMVEQER